MKALLSLASLYRQQFRPLALALCLSLLTILAGVALLGTSGWFITATALTTAGVGFNLFVPSSLVRGFSFLRIAARYGERLASHDATLKLLSQLRGWLFGALFPRLPLPDRSLRHGDLVSRLTTDIDALDTAFLVAIGPWFAAFVIGTTMTTVLWVLLPAAAPIYGGAALAAITIVPAALMLFGRSLGKASVLASAALRLAVLDGMQGHADLVLLGALGTTQARFNAAADDLSRARVRVSAVAALGGLTVQGLAALALAGTLMTGLAAQMDGKLSAPVLVGLLLAVLGSFEATSMVVRSVGKATQALAAAERLRDLADLPPAVVDPAKPMALPANGTIAVEGVHFAYPDRPAVLWDCSFSINPGERVAIVGRSGGGKTTLLHLLLRLADPQLGRLTFGGTDLRRAQQADIHARFALLGQNSPVFIDTIRNNLTIGHASAGDDALWTALEKAQLADTVRALPAGLETIMGEGGCTLSAGQARRLCLARALVSDAPVILLDEPTSALDRATEESFFHTLATAMKGRTVIMATHASLPPGTVDRVLTLHGGRLD